MVKCFLIMMICLYSMTSAFSDPCQIDSAYFRKAHALDSGSAHIYVKNTGTTPVKIKRVFLNDEHLKLSHCPNETVRWFKTTPNPARPGQIAEIIINFTSAPKQLLKIEIETTEGSHLKRVIQIMPMRLPITNISFSHDFKTIYFYIENNSQHPAHINRVFLNSEDITDHVQQKTQSIATGKKSLTIANLEKALKKGSFISIKVEFDNEDVTQSLVRVSRVFPISSWDADTRENLGFDPYPFRFNSYQSKFDKIPKQNPTPICLLMDHPNCLDYEEKKPLGFHASRVIQRQNNIHQKYPEYPTLTYGCEHRKPEAYFVYGEITDIFLVDPYEVVFHNKTPKDNAYFARLGKLACAPRVLFTTPGAFFQEVQGGANRFLNQDELIDTVLYEIGAGSKGIIYFNKNFAGGKGYQDIPELEQGIGKINRIIRELKDLILISEPIRMSKPLTNVDIATLLCADNGILVFARNQNNTDHNSKIEIEVPEWLSIAKCYQMTLDGEKKEIPLSEINHVLSLPIPAPNTWHIYILSVDDK